MKCIYTSIIRSKLEYCSNVYASSLSAGNAMLLERCQNRAVRVICHAPLTFSATDGRISFGIHTLASRRNVRFDESVQLLISGRGSTHLQDMISRQKGGRSLRTDCSLILPNATNNCGKRRFTFRAISSLKRATQVSHSFFM